MLIIGAGYCNREIGEYNSLAEVVKRNKNLRIVAKLHSCASRG
jgi:hypothetical protein